MQIASSTALDIVGEHLMSVVLPVPPGRSDEWNHRVDHSHMPTVLTLEGTITVGHRFALLRSSDEDAHLVRYEFPTAAAVDRFASGAIPAAKKTEYFDRWGVCNQRRWLHVVERWAGRG